MVGALFAQLYDDNTKVCRNIFLCLTSSQRSSLTEVLADVKFLCLLAVW